MRVDRSLGETPDCFAQTEDREAGDPQKKQKNAYYLLSDTHLSAAIFPQLISTHGNEKFVVRIGSHSRCRVFLRNLASGGLGGRVARQIRRTTVPHEPFADRGVQVRPPPLRSGHER